MDVYRSFSELKRFYEEHEDWHIAFSNRSSPVLVAAIHGGGIEPGTSELVMEMGEKHGFNSYVFSGDCRKDNHLLHLTSTRFDEPIGVEMASLANTTVFLHGMEGEESYVSIGGLDDRLKDRIEGALMKMGFCVVAPPSRLTGKQINNICNRNKRGKGVQIELSAGLRRLMFSDFSRRGRGHTKTLLFDSFVDTVGKAIIEVETLHKIE